MKTLIWNTLRSPETTLYSQLMGTISNWGCGIVSILSICVLVCKVSNFGKCTVLFFLFKNVRFEELKQKKCTSFLKLGRKKLASERYVLQFVHFFSSSPDYEPNSCHVIYVFSNLIREHTTKQFHICYIRMWIFYIMQKM